MIALLALLLAPSLRLEVPLNGVWDGGRVVPEYQGVPTDETVYSRKVDVPSAWAGKRIKLEFRSVNFVADVYIDDQHVAKHVGGWMPFQLDVTERVHPGKPFRLRVAVKGPKHAPITDSNGGYAWPVGGWGSAKRGGITGDVFLRAYGEVHIEDAFVQTSVSKRSLTIDYEIKNEGKKARTVRLAATAKNRKIVGDPVTLAPGERRTVRVAAQWPDAELWWPDRPVLHTLHSEVHEGSRLLDSETRRFGFREISIRGNQFEINGVRASLFGDYQVFGDTWYTEPSLYTPENWPRTVDQILAMNIRILRFHHEPVPDYILEVADEKGLLICAEAANYARDYHRKSNQAEYLKNAHASIEPWIRAHRNHPSIYMWNATNEMTHTFAGSWDPVELRKLGDEIRRVDPTRPVGYDGDRIVDGEIVDYHYPEGYNKEPRGSIYSWARYVHPRKPTGAGEMLHTKSPLKEVQPAMERNTRWLGLWLRGLRYSGWTNVKPAVWWYAWKDGFKGPRAETLRNALAPVALFDKEYDDLGIDGATPVLAAGTRTTRRLILYNDDFRGSSVTARVTLRPGGTGSAQVEIAPGGHTLLDCAFTVPQGDFELVLETLKDGRPRFQEVRRFRGAGNGSAAGEMTLRPAPAPKQYALVIHDWHAVSNGAATAMKPCDDTQCVVVGPWQDGKSPARWEYRNRIPVTDGVLFGRYLTRGLHPKQAEVRIDFHAGDKRLTTRTYSLAPAPVPFWGSFDIPIFRAPQGADSIRVSVGLGEMTGGSVEFTDLRVSTDRYPVGFREPELLSRAKAPEKLAPSRFARVHKEGSTWWLVRPDGTPYFDLGVLTASAGKANVPSMAAEVRRLGFTSLAGSHSLAAFAAHNKALVAAGQPPLLQYRNIEVNTDGKYANVLDAQGRLPGAPPEQAKARGGFNHAFADPWDPAFDEHVRGQVRRYLDDVAGAPYFVAWFGGNEREHSDLHRFVYGPYSSKELVAFLRAKYSDVSALNAAWAFKLASFEDVLTARPDPVKRQGALYEDFRAFSRAMLRRYNDVFIRVIRAEDPGRLIISNRFMVGEQRDVLENLDCYDGFDIIAVNIYPKNIAPGLAGDEAAFLRAVHERTGKPILIGEWSVPALDSGLYANPARLDWSYPQTVETQADRAHQAAQIVTDLFNMPFVVGLHWFTWSDYDSPVRQANRGLFKASGEPWSELQQSLQSVHELIRSRQ